MIETTADDGAAERATDPGAAEPLSAPFPWFGGKRRVSPIVWPRFGAVDTYNEPFAGSLAVLLGRPDAPRVETVNDLDCFLANFWRALQADPDGVAYYADSPVNEADLHARHRWLVEHARPHAERVMFEPDFYDVKIAGWWVWGQCLWIGSGWCQDVATGRRTEPAKKRTKLRERGNDGVAFQRSAATRSGERPHEQRKTFKSSHSDSIAGVHHRWQGGGQGGGSGVHAPRLTAHWRQKPDLSGDSGATGRGIHASGRSQGLYDYLGALAVRLRRVRVCCGDWRRVLTPSVTTYIGATGVFLDPPYSHDLRERCYSEDHDISADVCAWALEHGDNPDMRIALCGYEGEHEMPAAWECVQWKAHGGYSRSVRGRANRERERIWFSPHCLKPSGGLFDGIED